MPGHTAVKRAMPIALAALLVLAAAGWDEPQKPGELKPSESIEAPEVDIARSLPPALEAKLPRIQDIKPLPQTVIPDDPPPHEGARIDIPYVVEPPDLIRVEVLEALPGRPITGERVVRPDGTITLGFYGDVHVAGLTLPQIKLKILLHLRKYLHDEVLGIAEFPEEPPTEGPEMPEPPPPLPPTPNGALLLVPAPGGAPVYLNVRPPQPAPESPAAPDRGVAPGEGPKLPEVMPEPPPDPPPSTPRARRPSQPGRPRAHTRPTRRRHVHPVRARVVADEPEGQRTASNPSPPAQVVGIGPNGTVKITIEVQGAQARPRGEMPPATDGLAQGVTQVGPDTYLYEGHRIKIPPPEENQRVYVDVESYNSKTYFVLGDFALPGRLPITGNEMVLDAIEYAGGFSPTADPKSLRLIRPARAGKPAKVYPIDVEAIQARGDSKANLQILPGDRLVVDRNPVVQATVELDRQAAPLLTMYNQMLTYASAMRQLAELESPGPSASLHLRFGGRGVTLSIGPERQPTDRARQEAILKQWAEFFAKATPPGAPAVDGPSVRAAILRHFRSLPRMAGAAPAAGSDSRKEPRE